MIIELANSRLINVVSFPVTAIASHPMLANWCAWCGGNGLVPR